jgi:hypothetical protein
MANAISAGHSHVEIERGRFLEIKAHFLHLAVHRSSEKLALAFYGFPFEPYAPVRRQLLALLRAVNLARREAGYRELPVEVLPLRRRIVRPFGKSDEKDAVTIPQRKNESLAHPQYVDGRFIAKKPARQPCSDNIR